MWKTAGFNQRILIQNIGIQWAVTARKGEMLKKGLWVMSDNKSVIILLCCSAGKWSSVICPMLIGLISLGRELSLFLSLCMPTHAYTHMCICAHTQMHVHTHICPHAHTCKLQRTSPEMFSLPGKLELRVKELHLSLHPPQSPLFSVGRRCLACTTS